MLASDPLSDDKTPWYVRAVVWFGAPTVASGYLIYVLVNSISIGQANIMANQAIIIANQQQVLESLRQQSASNNATSLDLRRIETVLVQICVNGAMSSRERTICVTR